MISPLYQATIPRRLNQSMSFGSNMRVPPPQPSSHNEASLSPSDSQNIACFKSLLEGDSAQLETVLAGLDRVDFCNAQGQTPMQCLLTQAMVLPIDPVCRMMSALLKKGADPNSQTLTPALTPLEHLMRRFHENPDQVMAVAEKFLTAGANPNTATLSNHHPLVALVEYGTQGCTPAQATAMLKRLLAEKPDLVMLERGKVLEKVAHGLLVQTSPVDQGGGSKRRPSVDWIEGLELLIHYGMQPGLYNWAILQAPLRSDLPQTYRFLRNLMPKNEVPDAVSYLLRLATEWARPQMMRLILAEPVDFHQSKFGKPNSLLLEHLGESDPNLEVMRLLIQAGANPTDQGRRVQQYTALHRACEGRLTDEAVYDDREGLHFKREEWTEGVEVLLEAPNLNVNCFDHQGKTPLITACQKGYVNVVRRLLDAGADPTVRIGLADVAAIDFAARNQGMGPTQKRMLLRLLEEAAQSWAGGQTP